MRRLMLLRHAKTERAEPGERDRDRKLTKRGRADAPLIGAYMARHRFIPDLVLVSPAQRTVETWALVEAAFSKAPKVVKNDRIYNAGTETLAELIRETDDARSRLAHPDPPLARSNRLETAHHEEMRSMQRLSRQPKGMRA